MKDLQNKTFTKFSLIPFQFNCSRLDAIIKLKIEEPLILFNI